MPPVRAAVLHPCLSRHPALRCVAYVFPGAGDFELRYLGRDEDQWSIPKFTTCHFAPLLPHFCEFAQNCERKRGEGAGIILHNATMCPCAQCTVGDSAK
jgi:hypothetical protein